MRTERLHLPLFAAGPTSGLDPDQVQASRWKINTAFCHALSFNEEKIFPAKGSDKGIRS